MCYKYKDPEDLNEAKATFNANVTHLDIFDPERHKEGFANGFAHPYMPIILDNSPREIVPGYWGLVHENKANVDRKFLFKTSNTLNARIEDVETTYSFKSYTGNRCLVIAEYFVEYKHVPSSTGKSTPDKIPYKIYGPGRKPFAMAGLYSMIGDEPTYTILTTEANTLMAEIHNSAKRMPVVLRPEEVPLWIDKGKREIALEAFHSRKEVELEAVPLHGGTPPIVTQPTLF